jgi:hypothetical protein
MDRHHAIDSAIVQVNTFSGSLMVFMREPAYLAQKRHPITIC